MPMLPPTSQKSHVSRFLGTILPLFFIALPIAIYLWFLHTFAVSLPFADEWEFWWSMKGMDAGDWHLALWLPHNEHRLVVTRLFFFLLRYTNGLDVTVAMYFNVLLLCLTLWGLWLLLRLSVRVSLWYLVPLAYLLFSLAQWENILWGWQIAIYSMVCSSTWALYFLARSGKRNLSFAILMAIVASLSFVNGLMIWPAGFCYLLLARCRRHRLWAWCVAAAAMLAIYFYNYVNQVTRPSPTALVRPKSLGEFFAAPLDLLGIDPLSLPGMIFGNVGALLAPQHFGRAIAFGALTIIAFVVCLVILFRTRSAWETMPLALVALMLVSLLSTMSIIVGRMGYWDKEFVLSSRYMSITMLGIAATYLLAVVLAHAPIIVNRNYRRFALEICTVLLLAFVLGLPEGYQLGLSKGAEQRTLRLQQLEIVRNFETRSDEELASVYPKMLRERLLYWKSHHLVPFDQ